MAVLTKDIQVVERDGDISSLPLDASTKVYRGALVMVDTNGLHKGAAPKQNVNFVGVAMAPADTANGDKNVMVRHNRFHELNGAGFVAGDAGKTVYADDDGTVTITQGTTYKPIVGKIVSVISATKVLVKITPYMGTGAGS